MRHVLSIIGHIALCLVMLLLFVFYGNYYLFLGLMVMIFLPAIALIANAYATSKLRVEFVTKNANYGTKTKPVSLTMIVYNPTIIPLLNVNVSLVYKHLYYDKTENTRWNIPIGARGKTEIVLDFTPLANGLIHIETNEISSIDFLYLKKKIQKSSYEINIPIYPLQTEGFQMSYSNKVKGNEGEEEGEGDFLNSSSVKDLREYRPGDRLQTVHWKLSGKKEQFIVKEFDTIASNEIDVYISLVHHEAMDELIETANVFALQLIKEQIPFCIFYYSETRSEVLSLRVDSREDWDQFLLQIYYETPSRSYEKALANFCHFIDRENNFYMISFKEHLNETWEEALSINENTCVCLKNGG